MPPKRKNTTTDKGNANAGTNSGDSTEGQRLTEQQKKENHIASEKRRRENIKDGFQALCDLVPTLANATSNSQKSEAVILQNSIDYINHLLRQQQELKLRIDNAMLILQSDADVQQQQSIQFNKSDELV